MRDLPGVDPDGKYPGGVEVAGNVESGTFTKGGEPLVGATPLVYFHGFSANAVTVASQASFSPLVSLDISTIAHTDTPFTLDVDNVTLHITKPGMYLAFYNVYPDSGTLGAGQAIGFLQGDGNNLGAEFPNTGAATDQQWGGAGGINLVPIAASGSIHISAGQDSGASVDMDAQLVVVRLGSI